MRNIADIFSAPRNIGRNKWQFATFGDLQTADDYLHIMQMRAYSSWSKDFWVELGKKSTKKNKFSVNSLVESYKYEFLKNAELTFLNNNLKINFLPNGVSSNKLIAQNGFNDRFILQSGNSLFVDLLKTNKKSFYILDKSNKIKNQFLFLNLSTDRVLKQNDFKKNMRMVSNRKTPDINHQIIKVIRSWDYTNNEAYNNFFKNTILNTKQHQLVQHPDLDDETRIIKKNSGKNTPIRVLKYPKNNLFMSDDNSSNVELFRFRFNDKTSTTANKPIKNTIYLTFKQKRYNQRNNITKKSLMFIDKDTRKKQKYSGNPFLKNLSIIEENFGNPTRQYKLVKKAKSRLDTTRVGGWNRLLRSRRVLVLPAHINITVITNSFDIVHS